MSSFLVLSLVSFASIAILLTMTGAVLFRMGIRALAYWLLGWAALLEAGFVTLLIPEYPAIEAIGPLFSTFVAPLMLIGAFAHTDRPEPIWILPTSFFVSALRAAGYLLGHPEHSISIAMATEPMVAFAAAWIILHPRREPASPVPVNDRILAVGFLLYGVVEYFDAWSRSHGGFGWTNWIAWISVGLPLATIQIALHLDRFGRRARRYRDEARTNEIRLRALAASSLGFLAEFDAHGILTFTSAEANLAPGDLRQSLVGRYLFDFLPPDADSPIARALKEHRRLTPGDVAAESSAPQRALLPNGSERWFEYSLTSYSTPDGELRVLSRVLDVTERAARDERLRKSEEMLRRAERISGVASWELDLRSGEITCSDAVSRLFGLEPGDGPLTREILGRHIYPEDRDLTIEQVLHLPDRASPIDYQYRIIRASDGQVRTLRMVVEADVDAAGEYTRVVGTTIDITDQLELTNRLRLGQERFQSLIESNIVSVFIAQREGRIHEANDAFLSRLGYTKSDLPLDWRELTAPEYRGEDDVRAQMSEDSGLPLPFEKEFVARDGRRIPMLMSVVQISLNTAIMIGVDLSDRRRAESDRAQHQQELEMTVELRTRELLESRARLIESERLAVVGTLAAGVAHQINNPIGAILNCSEYALVCRDDADAREIFERALLDNLAEARRCAQIVRSMLQFSRDQPTTKWVEDLNRVVRRAQRAISAYAKDRGATISFATEDESLLARISPIELEQAIVNVLHNAIESRSRDARISIVLARRDKWAILEIIDDGCGIPPEHQERLFEPFFSTRTREGGTGLGLSVAHGIVTDHGGQIRIESFLETGTRVVITLPIASPPPDLEIGLRRGN